MANNLPIQGIQNSTDAKIEENNHCRRHSIGGLNEHATIPIQPLNLIALSQNFQIISPPTDEDDLETTARKMEQLAQVVQQGNSLALWTGLRLAPERPRSAESIAMEQMSPQERTQYEAWKKLRDANTDTESNSSAACSRDISNDIDESNTPLSLPNFDWDANIEPIPQGQQSLKKFTQRAAAMDIVFGHQGATPEHASWLTFNMVPLLPLIKAVTKVCNTEKHLETRGNPHAQNLSDMEAVEVETARRIVAAAERNRTREMQKIHRLTKSITECSSRIKSRAQTLEINVAKDTSWD